MSDMQAVEPQVRQAMSSVLGLAPEEIRPGTSPDTVERWDSLQHINLVLSLEESFGVQFGPDEIAEMLTYEKIVETVTRKLQ